LLIQLNQESGKFSGILLILLIPATHWGIGFRDIFSPVHKSECSGFYSCQRKC